jgi:DNA modification methylase
VGFAMPEALTGHIKGCYAEDGSRMAVGFDSAPGDRGNNHPTVKPIALMTYLIKLITPDSTKDYQCKVLDPFNGSGSTGMAATALGHHYTGCDLDEKYIAISRTRIDAWNKKDEPTNMMGDLFTELDEDTESLNNTFTME